jgi:hypothetical protein
MGYQPQAKTPKRTVHEYRKPLREKAKSKKLAQKRLSRQLIEEKPNSTEREISELTLKRLHNLGSQRFGSFPFSEHFNRWLANVEVVLDEFKAHPTIGVDDQFVSKCAETLLAIKHQLEDRSRMEASVDQEVKNLSDHKNRLQQIKTEYSIATSTLRGQRNTQIRRLHRSLNQLKKEQDRIIRIKTGFWRGISKKERERREIAVVEELAETQTKIELAVMDLKAAQKKLRDDYEANKEPVVAEIKKFQKKIDALDTDGSLEERWFACETLIDAVNSFLQRKATQPSGGQNKNLL